MKKVIALYILVAAISLSLSYLLHLLRPVALDTAGTNFFVESGMGFREISRALADAGLIRSEAIFKIYSFLSGSAHRLKAGAYSLSPSLSTPEIIGILVKGPETDIKVTIVEGEKVAEIDEQLSKLDIIKAGELTAFKWQDLKREFSFLKGAKSLEGFLFPDTYRFYPESSPESVVRKFLENFQAKAWPQLIQKSKTPYELLIIASIIEKEVPFKKDRLLVSGIIYRRLAIDMPLQVDAAPETYQYYGLPAAPIANPGLEAIYAAAHPQSSQYLYYLSDPKTKKTIFSETFEAHDDNRSRYLKK